LTNKLLDSSNNLIVDLTEKGKKLDKAFDLAETLSQEGLESIKSFSKNSSFVKDELLILVENIKEISYQIKTTQQKFSFLTNGLGTLSSYFEKFFTKK